jgi:hypothetical protein
MTSPTARSVIDTFNAAWNARDLDGALALVTDDCVFESTGPAPDGLRHVGKDALRAVWKPVFDNPATHFDFEDGFGAGDRYVMRWRYTWGAGHVRGVDIFTVAGDRISAKLSYVKG